MTSDHQYTNQLINETSPYLLQHAHNPVDWHAWNDASLDKARKEKKLMLISIGYAACHWCHVMEHESFEDSTVAALMNAHFINIKVDREERPDVDQIYMDACNLITGRGGWPLNAIALPDGRPIFAGTYYPKEQWVRILNAVVDLYETEPEKAIEQAERLTQGLADMEALPLNPEPPEFSDDQVHGMFHSWKSSMDMVKGGKIGAPKFPMPNNHQFLLRYHRMTGQEKALESVLVTLDNMAAGGIYDQIGGGFARYSVDADWIVPHFEKMLYDNGQLISLYSEAFQITKNPEYRTIVFETIAFVQRELMSPDYAFYSSLDADSEGEEGKYYVWQKDEVLEVLGKDGQLVCDFFKISEEGNWEQTNILLKSRNIDQLAAKYDLTPTELSAKIEQAKKRLLEEREKRIRPGLDDKALTSWNALMLSGLIDAYRVFDEPQFLELALNNANFISARCIKEDFRIDRNYKAGASSINGFLDDYSLTIEAFIKLYQATFDEQWLEKSRGLARYAIDHFFDDSTGMFFYTSDLDDALIVRKKETSDNVIPASNSSMAKGLYYLGLYDYNRDFTKKAKQMVHNIAPSINRYPSYFSNWGILLIHLVEEPFEIAIVGPDHQKLRKLLDRHYLPNALLLGGDTEGGLELLENKLVEGQTTIYVCKNKSCQLPVTTVPEALVQLGIHQSGPGK